MSEPRPPVGFVIITGLSGAGKSYAIKCFEDMGYFCVDNLPTALIPTFAELCAESSRQIDQIALGMDVREGEYLVHLSRRSRRSARGGIASRCCSSRPRTRRWSAAITRRGGGTRWRERATSSTASAPSARRWPICARSPAT